MLKDITRIGSALLQGDFSGLVKGIPTTIPIDPADYRGANGEEGWSYMTGDGAHAYFKYHGYGQCVTAYEKCPAVSAIINKKAQSFIDGKVWVLNTNGKEAKTPQATKLRTLLKKPNLLQSWDEFLAQMYIYVQLFGFCPMIAIKRTGFEENIDAKALWNIPPNFIDFEYTNKLYKETGLDGVLKTIYIRYGGKRIPIPTKDICIVRDMSPSLQGNMIFPESRIATLVDPINNSIGAYESRNILINYRGALGIFSKDTGGGSSGFPSPPITPDEKNDLQKDFQRYGLRKQQWQFIITSAAVKWQSVGASPKELLLFEEVEAATMSICDRYNYPYQLMAAAKGTTFANVAEGHKVLYTGAILPEAKSLFEQLNTFFDLETYSLRLDMDYSAVAALQKDKKAEAEARASRDAAYKIEWDNNACTLNEWRIANGDDPLPGAIGTLLKSQLTTVDEFPLSFAIGTDGVNAVVGIISNINLSKQTAQAILEIVYNIPAPKAARLVADKTVSDGNEQETEQQQTAEAA